MSIQQIVAMFSAMSKTLSLDEVEEQAAFWCVQSSMSKSKEAFLIWYGFEIVAQYLRGQITIELLRERLGKHFEAMSVELFGKTWEPIIAKGA